MEKLDLHFENKQGVKLRVADKCHLCNKSADMNIGICYDCESKINSKTKKSSN